MADRICIIKREAVARCGSYEVLFADGRTVEARLERGTEAHAAPVVRPFKT
jgi:hypothetical protein